MSEDVQNDTGTKVDRYGTECLAKALAKAQGQIEAATKGKENTFFKNAQGKASRYADLAAVWEACREALSSNGLSVVQMPIEAPEGKVGLRTYLLHESGQSLVEHFFMPIKDPTNAQAVGSAITYARRYALAAAVGVSPDDDDGNSASGNNKPLVKAKPPPLPDDDYTLIQRFWGRFDVHETAKDVASMKLTYIQAKDSAMSETAKTQLLAGMADRIRKVTSEEQKK